MGHNFYEMRGDLEVKEEEFDKSKYTKEMIEQRNSSLNKQLANVWLVYQYWFSIQHGNNIS